MKVGGFDNEQKKKKKKKRLRKPKANRKQMLENSLKSMLPNSKLIWKDDGDKLSEAIVELANLSLKSVQTLRNRKSCYLFRFLFGICVMFPKKKPISLGRIYMKKFVKGINRQLEIWMR